MTLLYSWLSSHWKSNECSLCCFRCGCILCETSWLGFWGNQNIWRHTGTALYVGNVWDAKQFWNLGLPCTFPLHYFFFVLFLPYIYKPILQTFSWERIKRGGINVNVLSLQNVPFCLNITYCNYLPSCFSCFACSCLCAVHTTWHCTTDTQQTHSWTRWTYKRKDVHREREMLMFIAEHSRIPKPKMYAKIAVWGSYHDFPGIIIYLLWTPLKKTHFMFKCLPSTAGILFFFAPQDLNPKPTSSY